MDSRKDKWQQYMRYKSSGFQRSHQFDRSNYDVMSKYKIYRASPQRYSSRGKYGYVRGENFKSNASYKRKPPCTSPVLTAEEAEEEERKKKLSDAANKLLSKIKTWSAEKSSSDNLQNSENDCGQTSVNLENSNSQNVNQFSSNSSSVGNVESTSVDGKRKRIAHSKIKNKVSNVVKSVPKNCNQIVKSPKKPKKYEVNKATVKDFQNRIQHKLINEIMLMPKENLQNVLNDPKINPIMELKMSRLVKENKLLIAQKLRALAESKMSLNTNSTSSQLLVDIDKLIDPVIETDLSALPYELIKKMENIFQVQFDYSNSGNNETELLNAEFEPNFSANEALVEQSSGVIDGSPDNFTKPGDHLDSNVANVECESKSNLNENSTLPCSLVDNCISSKVNAGALDLDFDQNDSRNIKSENNSCNEDLTVYECTTDEDEEPTNEFNFKKQCQDNSKIAEDEVFTSSQQNQTLTVSQSPKRETDDDSNTNKRRRVCSGSDVRNSFEEMEVSEENVKSGILSPVHIKNNDECFMNVNNCDLPEPVGQKLTSTSCQTENSSETTSTQTENELDDPSVLYGVPLPEKSIDDSPASLLEEVNSIQNLINKLNERRFMIFLQLTKKDSSLSFINNQFTRDNFVETISNGNICLMSLLNQLSTGVETETSKNYRKWNHFNKKRKN